MKNIKKIVFRIFYSIFRNVLKEEGLMNALGTLSVLYKKYGVGTSASRFTSDNITILFRDGISDSEELSETALCVALKMAENGFFEDADELLNDPCVRGYGREFYEEKAFPSMRAKYLEEGKPEEALNLVREKRRKLERKLKRKHEVVDLDYVYEVAKAMDQSGCKEEALELIERFSDTFSRKDFLYIEYLELIRMTDEGFGHFVEIILRKLKDCDNDREKEEDGKNYYDGAMSDLLGDYWLLKQGERGHAYHLGSQVFHLEEREHDLRRANLYDFIYLLLKFGEDFHGNQEIMEADDFFYKALLHLHRIAGDKYREGFSWSELAVLVGTLLDYKPDYKKYFDESFLDRLSAEDTQRQYDDKIKLAEGHVEAKNFTRALAELKDLDTVSFENAVFELAPALMENIETESHYEEFFDACYAISPLAAYHFDEAFTDPEEGYVFKLPHSDFTAPK